MKKLYYKVLEIKEQNSHTADDIDDIVKSRIEKLNEEYNTRYDRNKTRGKYISDEYKAFVTYTGKDADTYENLLDECIIRTTNIANFIDGKTKRPQNVTKDFFAVYCECDGYNDFVVKYKNIEVVESIYKPLIEKSKFSISGATIVDFDFISKTEKEVFSMAEFYTAKQDETCQWSGILQNFDVIRNDYDKIKGIVQQGFKDQNCRVSAIIYGNGGCGKSTLLKRLAIEVSQEQLQKSSEEQIKIVWLNDDGFEDFYAEGLLIIKQNQDIIFLVIIDDWFNITKHDKEIAYKFLKKTKSISNIRIVIGDRIIEKECKDLLDGEPVLLSPDENEYIITKILESNNAWKNIADQLFTDKNNYQCSLFLLLFIMSFASQNEDIELNFSKPKKAFIDIIENDLKFISNTEDKKYVGLAKALYYWACIYERHRIYISYDTFLAIADHYNENNKISKYFCRWEMEDPILDRLKIYINKNYSLGKYSDKDFVQFNHDILADEGLSKVDWGFNNRVKIDLLEVITDKGDDASASKYLSTMLSNEKHIFVNSEQKLYFIKKLIEKGNRNQNYLFELSHLTLENDQLKEIAQLVWNRNIDSVLFWGRYFRQIKNDDIICKHISKILDKEYLTGYNPDFIGLVLKYTPDTHVKNDFIKDMLLGNDIENIPERILIDCLKYGTDDEKKKFSDKFLINDNLDKTLLTSTCLFYASKSVRQKFFSKVSKIKVWEKKGGLRIITAYSLFSDSDKTKQFCEKILKDENWKYIEYNIIDYCFGYSHIEVKQFFSDRALKDNNYHFVNISLFRRCLICSSDDVRRDFLYKVSQKSDFTIYNSLFLEACFDYASDSTKENLANKFLMHPYIWDLLIDRTRLDSIKYASDETRKMFLLRFIELNLKNPENIFSYHCLGYFENENEIPIEIHKVIKTVINAEKVSHKEFNHYYKLLMINFFNDDVWRKETERIIENWENESIFTVYSTLYGYRSQPKRIQKICSEILSQWMKFINPDSTIGIIDSHLKQALGHPYLRKEAKQVAQAMLLQLDRKENGKNEQAFRYISNMCSQIVENDIYPEWETGKKY